MLKWYGYLGIALLLFANINFFLVIQPFAEWYIPIVWFGYILFIDSLVYRIRKGSWITRHFKDFVFVALLSLPFWSISEGYNVLSGTWTYTNYVWYVHVIDFTTIMPALLETFSLIKAAGLFKRISVRPFPKRWITPMLPLGAMILILPLFSPQSAFPIIWLGLFLATDPINYLLGGTSILNKLHKGDGSMFFQLMLSGITMGFFWEFWNHMAYPQWIYHLLPAFLPSFRLFAMPIIGYIGYFPFALSVFSFYELFRLLVFRRKNNPLLSS